MAATIIISAFLGLFIGSFINVLVLRTRSGKNWVSGRSECPHCHKTLTWYELVPVFSYLAQHGKCRGCHTKISTQYPIVELLCGFIYAGIAFHFSPTTANSWAMIVFWMLISIPLIAAAIYDARWQQLPDGFTLPVIGASLVYLTWLQFGLHQSILMDRLIAAVIFGGIIYLVWTVSSGRAIGDGDIRLAVIMALLFTAPQLILAIIISVNLAAIVAITLLVTKKKKRRDHMPLGTYMIAGIYLTLFFGGAILAWYGSLIGFNLT